MKERTQFNVRLCRELKDAAAKVCEELNYTRDELAEVALSTLLGSRDGVMIAKRRKIEKLADELQLSFNEPQAQLPGFEDQLAA